jgi:hypothetical protein
MHTFEHLRVSGWVLLYVITVTVVADDLISQFFGTRYKTAFSFISEVDVKINL